MSPMVSCYRTLDEHIAFCAQQAAACHEATCDESKCHAERLGAQQGEADWLAEKLWLEEQLEKSQLNRIDLYLAADWENCQPKFGGTHAKKRKHDQTT